ncbi:protein FAM192A [Durio zibethinus]|uniref:Protein FAM192A n=1 Tax=Durio zibethinus TaxID=66656 RepID=A0A6P5ZYA5_DURZI|nr:protein FAM192A [Durio zibethinus]
MADESSNSIKLMNFVSEQQLDEAKRTRGERIEDGTAQRDRPLYEILKENKDKKDAEFNERFKHRPPKPLDEDETEFLDNLETSRREYERQVADEEAEQLRSFQAAVAARSNIVHELKETPPVPASQEHKSVGRKNPATRPLSMIIKVKPQAKKAKIDQEKELPNTIRAPDVDTVKTPNPLNTPNGDTNKSVDVAKTGLVSYSDESEDD